MIALLLTAEAVRWPFQDLLGQRGELTLQQYNVLRILRGAGAAGLPTLEIGDRMIERTPGITRMIDRLEAKGLVERRRDTADRRQVLCFLTPGGRRLVDSLDAAMDELDDRAVSALTKAECRQLVTLLNKVRNSQTTE